MVTFDSEGSREGFDDRGLLVGRTVQPARPAHDHRLEPVVALGQRHDLGDNHAHGFRIRRRTLEQAPG